METLPYSPEAVTRILESAERRDVDPLDQLLPVVYSELRLMAKRALAKESSNQTLVTTELVHEAYLRLAASSSVTEKGRTYFFGAASRAMRLILVDRARRRASQKRGGGIRPERLSEADAVLDEFVTDIIDLDKALEELGALSPRAVRVIECRYFGGLTLEETADALNTSSRTVKRDWVLAKGFLKKSLKREPDV
jgi:RNA polymerase sigma factor (TIGR02999 family)